MLVGAQGVVGNSIGQSMLAELWWKQLNGLVVGTCTIGINPLREKYRAGSHCAVMDMVTGLGRLQRNFFS